MAELTTNSQYVHSNFFTNRNKNTLIKEFEGVLQHNNQIKNLDAVVGFLRASGYFSFLTGCPEKYAGSSWFPRIITHQLFFFSNLYSISSRTLL